MENLEKYILVVDDDEGIRKLTTKVISKSIDSIIEIIEAEDGENALNKIKEYNSKKALALIITDYSMPNKDGVDLISEVRSSDINYLGKIIMMSGTLGDAKRKFEEKGIETKDIDFIEKPVNISYLKDKVKSHLENHNGYQK